jgi:hypothetical protein
MRGNLADGRCAVIMRAVAMATRKDTTAVPVCCAVSPVSQSQSQSQSHCESCGNRGVCCFVKLPLDLACEETDSRGRNFLPMPRKQGRKCTRNLTSSKTAVRRRETCFSFLYDVSWKHLSLSNNYLGSWFKIADSRRSLGRYSSHVDSGHGVGSRCVH